MKVLDCERVRMHLDAYLDNELLVATSRDVARHLEGCPHCTAELDARSVLKARVRSAVRATPVPPELAARIRSRISVQRRAFTWQLVVALPVLMALGWFGFLRVRELLHMPPLPRDAVAAVLHIGVGDHVHCALFRRYPKDPPPLEKLAANLGPDYADVARALPREARVYLAHKCRHKGREFVHLALRESGGIVSIMITRRRNEHLGPDLRSARIERFHTAGFETRDHLVFIVSDRPDNLRIATALAPELRAALARIES